MDSLEPDAARRCLAG